MIEASLPPSLIFYRIPISAPEPEAHIQPPSRLRRATSSAAAELEAASEPLPKPPQPQMATVFGSVSTADIADSIKAILAETREGARIVIGAEDVAIVQDKDDEFGHQGIGIEGDRLKALGDFQVEIRVKGGEAVVRTVSVKPQETSQA